MSDRRSCVSPTRRLTLATAAIGGLSSAIAIDLALPSFAHNVKTDGDVGATFHLEPDHNPRSGETAQVWFALTREGGETIPLADCDCTLTVVNTKDETIEAEVSELTAIDAESYTDIPGAEITFPEPGVYALTIAGGASADAIEPFDAFELSYDVTVQPGEASEGDAVADGDDAETSAADGEGAESEQESKPFVDSWLWLAMSILTMGTGIALSAFVLLRKFAKGVIPVGKPRRQKAKPLSPLQAASAVLAAEPAPQLVSVTPEAGTSSAKESKPETPKPETTQPETTQPEAANAQPEEPKSSEVPARETQADSANDNGDRQPEPAPETEDKAELPQPSAETEAAVKAPDETPSDPESPSAIAAAAMPAEEIADSATTDAAATSPDPEKPDNKTEAAEPSEDESADKAGKSEEPADAIAAIKNWD